MSHSIHFSCTKCGKCCHDLGLPLSVEEAIAWLRAGGDVKCFSEAISWPVEPDVANLPAQHKRKRSFPAQSGKLPVRVTVTLVALFDGPCPNLGADMRCGIYSERPRVCRIYPAEVNPLIRLDPVSKACPPEAWTVDMPLFARDGRVVDTTTESLIEASRRADSADVAAKEILCQSLGISIAAMANEGVAVWSFERGVMSRALEACRDGVGREPAGGSQWRLMTNRDSTYQILEEIGAHPLSGSVSHDERLSYVDFSGGGNS